MKCPTCNAVSFVLETRELINRRRECFNGHRFTTREVFVRPVEKRSAKGDDRSPKGNTCRRRGCTGTMRPGKALWPTFTGTPDFPLDNEICTLRQGGPGKLVDCLKCDACGFSTTKGQP